MKTIKDLKEEFLKDKDPNQELSILMEEFGNHCVRYALDEGIESILVAERANMDYSEEFTDERNHFKFKYRASGFKYSSKILLQIKNLIET